jgi:hypothetical protein
VSAILAFLIGISALTYETHSQEWLLFILIVCHCYAREPVMVPLPGFNRQLLTPGASPEMSVTQQ